MDKEASEIVKLTERIAQDPKSKLFVPLAEEYKKIGDIEMAINVLQEGLKNNPGYVTARSSLGRLLLESGDLAGAQKELEEVIKAIPDNLLAQRKLGDLYILTGRSADALQRYRTALVLNPNDNELKSFIAELETGKDISARIPKPKVLAAEPAKPKEMTLTAPKTAPATAAPTGAPGIPPAKPATAAGRGTAPTAKPAPQPAAKQQDMVRPLPAPPPPPVPEAPAESDVIEEIVELELLEHPAPESPAAPEPSFELSAGDAFDLSEPAVEDASVPPQVEPMSWEPATFETAEVAASAPQADSGDDINTNTLAELYITQGFYEKAIEIYEGMLADRPGNRALQQKLEKIRTMAGVAEQNAAFAAPVVAPLDDTGKGDLFAPGGGAASPEQEQPASEEATVVRGRPAPAGTPEPAQQIGPHGASARRKETIDRLESWLKNIIKEKP